MKKFTDKLFWVFAILFAVVILYQKGLIFANFTNISATQAYQFSQDNNSTLIDVRTIEELKTDGAIKGALHIPLQQLKSRLSELDPYHDKRVILFCRSGSRSISASRILSDAGFHTYNLKGGINAWKQEKLPLR